MINQYFQTFYGGFSNRIMKRVFFFFEEISRFGRIGVYDEIKPLFNDTRFSLFQKMSDVYTQIVALTQDTLIFKVFLQLCIKKSNTDGKFSINNLKIHVKDKKEAWFHDTLNKILIILLFMDTISCQKEYE
jgi:hypothetical protein